MVHSGNYIFQTKPGWWSEQYMYRTDSVVWISKLMQLNANATETSTETSSAWWEVPEVPEGKKISTSYLQSKSFVWFNPNSQL